MKTGQSRIDDAVEYMQSIGLRELADHIVQTLPGYIQRQLLGRQLSLGSRPDDEDDPQYAANTSKRQALRALLLCQRVYFSDLWAKNSQGNLFNYLPAGWKTASLGHWSHQSEDSIRDGIRTFAQTSNTAADLAAAADTMPVPMNTPDLTVTRTMARFPGMISCYGAVITWMFKSGLASYRWYMRHQGARNKETLRAAFGPPLMVLWDGVRPFSATDALPLVPRGHIVHLYVDNPFRWPGHWLVSNGDGTACGCNNDTENGAVPNNYCDHCSLDAQFLYGYKHKLAPRGVDKEFADDLPKTPAVDLGYEKGVAEVFDPLLIPGLL